MTKKKKIIIIILSAFLCAIAALTIYKVFFSKPKDKVFVTVKNGLSVNFLNGNTLELGAKEKEYKFSITNDSDSEKYYQIRINNFKKPDKARYSLKSEESKIDLTDQNLNNEIILEYAVINPGDTHNYSLKLDKSLRNFTVGEIAVENYIFEEEYFAQTIIKNSTVSQNPKTVVGMEVSTEDEGLIQDIDDRGVTYYFRGNVLNNYVNFANLRWRIIRINGDNTVKLILDENAEELTEYYTSTDNNYFAYVNTNIKSYLSNWYQNNLASYEKFIASGKVCDNSQYTGTDDYIFQASQRLLVDHNPTFNCLGSSISTKISIITADEVEYAGGLVGVSNTNYYLYNQDIYNPSWTITPSKGSNREFYPFTLSVNGALEENNIGSVKRGVRPVINIVKDVPVTGKGTKDEPYEILV